MSNETLFIRCVVVVLAVVVLYVAGMILFLASGRRRLQTGMEWLLRLISALSDLL